MAFEKGNQLGVGYGRPSLTPAQRKLSLATRTQFKVLIQSYMVLTPKEIEEKLEEGNLPVIDITVLRHLKDMSKHGSMERTDWTIDHVMGTRPKESKVTVTANRGIDLSKLSKEQMDQIEKIAITAEIADEPE